jgi:hypothetical protein
MMHYWILGTIKLIGQTSHFPRIAIPNQGSNRKIEWKEYSDFAANKLADG